VTVVSGRAFVGAIVSTTGAEETSWARSALEGGFETLHEGLGVSSSSARGRGSRSNRAEVEGGAELRLGRTLGVVAVVAGRARNAIGQSLDRSVRASRTFGLETQFARATSVT